MGSAHSRERYLGLALADAGRFDEAETNLRAAIAYYDGLVGDGDHPLAATTRLALGETIARGPTAHAEAIAIVERATQQRERLFGACRRAHARKRARCSPICAPARRSRRLR